MLKPEDVEDCLKEILTYLNKDLDYSKFSKLLQ